MVKTVSLSHSFFSFHKFSQPYLKDVGQVSQIKYVVEFDRRWLEVVNYLLMKFNGSLDHGCGTILDARTEGLLL